MTDSEDFICRLCLRLAATNFMSVDETVREMLDVLSVKMNFKISKAPLMCEGCAELVKRSLSFKSTYLDSEETILMFRSDKNVTNIDLREVFTHNTKEVIVDVDTEICRFCLSKVVGSHFIALDHLIKETTYFAMFKEYMPEMDPKTSKNPIICLPCRDQMEDYFRLLQTCSDTEEKINAYRKSMKVKGKTVGLKNVSEHFGHYFAQIPIATVKIEEISSEDLTEMRSSCMVQIKKEFDDSERQETVDNSLKVDAMSPERPPLKIESEELDIKGELTSHETAEPRLGGRPPVLCVCKQKRMSCLKCSAMLEVVSVSPPMYKCKICPYRGPWIKKHMLKHKDVSEVQSYSCAHCEFQTKHRYCLRLHLLTHRDFSEVPVFKCDLCDYRAKYSRALALHVNTHKPEAEAKFYHCRTCDFKTKHHSNLKRHSLMHKRNWEVQMYKCDSCDYESKHKPSLKDHSLTHKDFSEVDPVQCRLCGLWQKSKRRLDGHMRRHNSKEIYECSYCPYKTRHKDYVKRHELKHKSTDEVEMFQCKVCDFRSKYKRSVALHMIVHKDSSEIEFHDCPLCPHKARNKYSLQRHVETHTKRRRKHECKQCLFRTYSKSGLKTHMKVHKEMSEVSTHRCPAKGCNFVTKWNLEKHIRTHNKVYKCDRCEFETVVQKVYKQHVLVHEEQDGEKVFWCRCGYGSKVIAYFKNHRDSHIQMKYKKWRYNKERD